MPAEDAAPLAPLGPEDTARLVEFARACKAAARAVLLYPAAHPAIAATLGRIVETTSGKTLPQPLRLKTIFENLSVSDAEAYYRDLVWLRSDARSALYAPEFANSLKGFTPMEMVLPFYTGSDARTPLARSQNADIHFYMTDDVLVKADRMSMAHSLEVRCPLLDYRLIEFGTRLPDDLKVRGRAGKLPLRELAARRLPEEVRNKPKQGFSIPAAKWLRGDLKPMAEALLFDASRPFGGVLDDQVVRGMWQEHQSAARDHSVFLWGLMMLSLWRRTSTADSRPV